MGHKATAAPTKKTGKGAARSAKSTAVETDKENTGVSHVVRQHIILTLSFSPRLSRKRRDRGSLGPEPMVPLLGEFKQLPVSDNIADSVDGSMLFMLDYCKENPSAPQMMTSAKFDRIFAVLPSSQMKVCEMQIYGRVKSY